MQMDKRAMKNTMKITGYTGYMVNLHIKLGIQMDKSVLNNIMNMENQMITLQFKTTNSSSITRSDWKTTDKQRHRLNGKPASQHWYANGQKSYEEYYENNQFHRLNGKPACQRWYPNGQDRYEKYCEYGKRHRLNGKPARQHWYESGRKEYEEYYEHGELIKYIVNM